MNKVHPRFAAVLAAQKAKQQAECKRINKLQRMAKQITAADCQRIAGKIITKELSHESHKAKP